MSQWTDMYRQKLMTPEEAVKVVQSGDWVDYGTERITKREKENEKNTRPSRSSSTRPWQRAVMNCKMSKSACA